MNPGNCCPGLGLFDGALQEQGVRIGQCPSQPAEHTSNLAAVQNILLGNAGHGLVPPKDDSLVLLEADNEWQAAEHLVLWLAAALV